MANLDRGQSALDELAQQRLVPSGAVQAAVRIVPITIEELQQAHLSPRVVLPDYLFADVRTRIAAGGVGKTTLALFEAATMALGRMLWRRQPDKPVRTVIVTREDSRETLVARLRKIMNAMNLCQFDVQRVIDNVIIVDLSGVGFRICEVVGDIVAPNLVNLNLLADKLQPWRPDWLIFDPLVSFGVGEARVNDSEQGLIEAFRILRNRLNCCVEGIHHSGKANARDKAIDQYAGRGGSALSDGCRMVAVLQPVDDKEWREVTGMPLRKGETAMVMALPKMSYCQPQEPIYILRSGYRFEMVQSLRRTPDEMAQATANQLFQFILSEHEFGRLYSMSDLENSKQQLNLTRAQIRAAVTALKVAGRVVYVEVKGKSGSHFQPLSVADACGDGA